MPTAQEIQEAIREKNRRILELEIQVKRLTQELEDARAPSAEPSAEVSSESVLDSTEESDLEGIMAESRRIVA